MAEERPGYTLEPTAPVHEAYLRLLGDLRFDGLCHFFVAPAEALRRVLVNHARDRARLQRDAGRHRVNPDQLSSPSDASDDDLLVGGQSPDSTMRTHSGLSSG
jgi:ECF sigma factor